MTLLLAIFQPGTFVILQHAMFAAVVPVAEAAVADDALGGFSTVLVPASNLARGHATAQRQGDVDRGRWRDVERGERGGGRRQGKMLAHVDQTEGGCGEGGAER